MTRTAGDTTSTTKYYYNEINELTRFNVDDGPFTEFSYDSNGNRTAKIEPDNRITSYQYDYENRLTEAIFHQGKWVGLEYDGDGNRITKYSAMTQPTYGNSGKTPQDNGIGNKTHRDNGIGNDPGFVPPGQQKAKKQRADLQYMLLSNDNGNGNDDGNGNDNGNGNGVAIHALWR